MKQALVLALATLALSSCSNKIEVKGGGGTVRTQNLDCASRTLTVLGTNDIHGNFEGKVFSPNSPDAPKRKIGGLAEFAGVVAAARSKEDDCHGVLVLDGGDQFQGTLLSNYSEGLLMAKVLRQIGYDAIVPGNHDYDFGPIGWENDSVEQANEGGHAGDLNALERFSLRTSARVARLNAQAQGIAPSAFVDPNDAKAALLRFRDEVKLPMLSANTYEQASLVDVNGKSVTATLTGCHVPEGAAPIDWSKAKRPAFLASHIVKEVAGLRVAVVGLDLTDTPSVTTKANVMDLCFRDPAEEFVALATELRKTVDAVIVVAHFGDPNFDPKIIRDAVPPATSTRRDDMNLTLFLDRVLTSPECKDGGCLDGVVGGHTHTVNQVRISGVPGIQSGSNAQRFGRMELVFDADTKAPLRDRTRAFGGKYFGDGYCDLGTESFCKVNGSGDAEYDGVVAKADPSIAAIVATEKAKTAVIAARVVGKSSAPLNPARIDESNIGDRLSDALLELGKERGAEVAFLNSGGIRTSLRAGDVTYEDLYQVLPFNNRAIVSPNFKVSNLLVAVQHAIQTCGNYGTLNFSGISIQFERDCTTPLSKSTQLDLNARLVRMETTAGELLYDGKLPEGKRLLSDRDIPVVTLDFLANGGDGLEAAFPPTLEKDVIARPYRENFVAQWLLAPFAWDGAIDGRMKNLSVAPIAPAPATPAR